MKAAACPLLTLSMLVAAGCWSAANKPTPGGGGNSGTAGATAGAAGTMSPDDATAAGVGKF